MRATGSMFDTIDSNVIRRRGYSLRTIKQHCIVNFVVPLYLYVAMSILGTAYIVQLLPLLNESHLVIIYIGL